jgi:hypothetical protein
MMLVVMLRHQLRVMLRHLLLLVMPPQCLLTHQTIQHSRQTAQRLGYPGLCCRPLSH